MRIRPGGRLAGAVALWVGLLVGGGLPARAAVRVLRCFPVGSIYDYRWKLLELALQHGQAGEEAVRVVPYAEDVTQDRSVRLVQSGAIDVIALGTNPGREASLLPIRLDILKGIIGYRVFLIRRSDEARIKTMDDATLRRSLTFGLERDWADLPIMVAGGFAVETAAHSENLFQMLAAGRFDAFPRGINEASHDLAENRDRYPGLALEPTKAIYFPYPVYFWVSRANPGLALRIERGLRLALADGSFRRLFLACYAREIAQARETRRHVIFLPNPYLPGAAADPETGWWWHRSLDNN